MYTLRINGGNMNRLIEIKNEKFIRELKKLFHRNFYFSTKVDKIVIQKSERPNEEKTLMVDAFNEKSEKVLTVNYISSEEKLNLIYDIIALLSENSVDLYKYWETILKFPDDLIEQGYY